MATAVNINGDWFISLLLDHSHAQAEAMQKMLALADSQAELIKNMQYQINLLADRMAAIEAKKETRTNAARG